jgi:hypothetical protein
MERVMNYILVFVLLLNNGSFMAAQEGKPAAVVFQTKEECNKQALIRIDQAKGQVPWVLPLCVPVPVVKEDAPPAPVSPTERGV